MLNLEDLSVITTSANKMSNNDQVLSNEVLETNNAITHIAGDNKDLNIVILMDTLPSTQWAGPKTPLWHHLCQIHR